MSVLFLCTCITQPKSVEVISSSCRCHIWILHEKLVQEESYNTTTIHLFVHVLIPSYTMMSLYRKYTCMYALMTRTNDVKLGVENDVLMTNRSILYAFHHCRSSIRSVLSVDIKYGIQKLWIWLLPLFCWQFNGCGGLRTVRWIEPRSRARFRTCESKARKVVLTFFKINDV